jgi:hypothetical protein
MRSAVARSGDRPIESAAVELLDEGHGVKQRSDRRSGVANALELLRPAQVTGQGDRVDIDGPLTIRTAPLTPAGPHDCTRASSRLAARASCSLATLGISTGTVPQFSQGGTAPSNAVLRTTPTRARRAPGAVHRSEPSNHASCVCTVVRSLACNCVNCGPVLASS